MICRAETMLPRIHFASSYVYSPRGRGSIAQHSRILCRMLKDADGRWLARCAWRVRQLVGEHPGLCDVLDPRAVLVPVPGRRPGAPAQTVAGRLTQALLEAGVGVGAWRGLHRIESVPKSATATRLERPSVASHYRSFRIEDPAVIESQHPAPLRLVLVDDVVTKGRTLLAAALRLHDAMPMAHISAFALLRTLGRIDDIGALVAPCRGEIRWLRGDAYRDP